MLPLEDDCSDILRKAQSGLRVSDEELARGAGVSIDDLHQLQSGAFNEEVLRRVASTLRLNADALARIARKEWYPQVQLPRDGIDACHHQLGDMVVNSYLVWDPATHTAAVFDTGDDAAPILDAAKRHSVRIADIFLTHSHHDHVDGLAGLRKATGAPAHSGALKPVPATATFKPGAAFTVGNLRIETRLTTGHSPGGTTYVVRGLELPVAMVGDALFAGSMGGGIVSYTDALKTNREQIFTLPDETILCPGHGPVTTVGLEKVNNPFFAEW